MTQETIKAYRDGKRHREIMFAKARAATVAYEEITTLKSRAWKALLQEGGARCEEVFRTYFLGE